ncbi:MAG: InlB B-repeat-containing protein, partial [Spirochaetaceae bacterium]|nr:InlB B-repeat-containing protein [Spirochaetaceae bacterium]
MENTRKGILTILISFFIAGCSIPFAEKNETTLTESNDSLKSSNADLSALTVSDGTLTPDFSPEIRAYTVSVADSVTEITVTGTGADTRASVMYSPSQTSPLSAEPDVITITVTAENKNTKEYTVTVLETGNTYCKALFISLGGSYTDEEIISQGGKIAKPSDPTREGYTFSGWFTRLAYETEWDFNSDVISADTILYAKWTNSETFAEADRPALIVYDADDLIVEDLGDPGINDDLSSDSYYYGIRLPWNYGKTENITREYPLHIQLHTGGGPISTPTPPKSSPSLVLSPKIPLTSDNRIWSTEALNWIVRLIEKIQ